MQPPRILLSSGCCGALVERVLTLSLSSKAFALPLSPLFLFSPPKMPCRFPRLSLVVLAAPAARTQVVTFVGNDLNAIVVAPFQTDRTDPTER